MWENSIEIAPSTCVKSMRNILDIVFNCCSPAKLNCLPIAPIQMKYGWWCANKWFVCVAMLRRNLDDQFDSSRFITVTCAMASHGVACQVAVSLYPNWAVLPNGVARSGHAAPHCTCHLTSRNSTFSCRKKQWNYLASERHTQFYWNPRPAQMPNKQMFEEECLWINYTRKTQRLPSHTRAVTSKNWNYFSVPARFGHV